MNHDFFLLGATGSVGESVLAAAKQTGYSLRGFAFQDNLVRAEEIIREFHPRFVITSNNENYRELRQNHPGIQILFGMNGILEMIAEDSSSTVVNALSGIVGLLPSLESLDAGKRLIIANKESVVAGSQVFLSRVRFENQVIPIDSEHWSLFLLLQNFKREKVKELILTASGGPFRNCSLEEMQKVTLEQALNHPVWSMGKSITVSSATLANKGMEVLEAKELFGFDLSRIRVSVHPQSKIHGMIRLSDGSLVTHLSRSSMIEPCRNALTYPEMISGDESYDLNGAVFEFEAADETRFPMLRLAYEAGKKGHVFQIVYTAANQRGVEFFLNRKIRFDCIAKGVEKTLEQFSDQKVESAEKILLIEQEANDVSQKIFEGLN